MKILIKKGIAILLCLVVSMSETNVFASDVAQNIVDTNEESNVIVLDETVQNESETVLSSKEKIVIGELGGYLVGSFGSTKNLYLERKFTTPMGHGFAAERANNLMDSLTDYNFLKYKNEVPDITALNSPDRKIINRSTKQELWIQDKYYSNANNTVNSAFDKTSGMYKYYDKYNKPMTLEVPKDQYEKAVQKMAEKIREGKINGVTDPNEAKNYVKEGHYTYKQVRNIAKAGNIDSLRYDATNGAIISLIPMGISFTIDFVSAVMNGDDTSEALKEAGLNSLKTGSIVFTSYMVTSQLTKSGLKTALKPTSKALANLLGKEGAEKLLKLYGVEYTKKNVMTKATSLIQNQIIVNSVVIIAMTAPQVYDLINGRISKEQFAKNLTVAIIGFGAGTAGALAGAKIGTAVAPGLGTIAGVAGGAILGTATAMGAGALAEIGLSKLYEGDANKMYEIITVKFQSLGEDYLLSQEEADEVVTELQKKLTPNNLKEMHASKDREQFAETMMEPMFEQVIKKRHKIEVPTEESTRQEWKRIMKGVALIH